MRNLTRWTFVNGWLRRLRRRGCRAMRRLRVSALGEHGDPIGCGVSRYGKRGAGPDGRAQAEGNPGRA